jgi:hypothetical protein
VTVDAWNRASARIAAGSVFSLGQDYPVLRPGSTVATERAAAALSPGTSPIPKRVVEPVIDALPVDDVARLVDLAAACAPRRWHTLVGEVGTELAREPLLAGIATAAIAELVPPPRWLVLMRESTADAAPGPLNVLATLLHPESVWSVDEIRAAHALASRLPLPGELAAIVSFANAEMTAWRAQRVRLVARAVVPLLPIAEAPRTSRQLADSHELLARGDAAAAELCQLLLLTAVLRLDGRVPVVPSRN